MFICTDFGHDTDDAVALAYLIERGYAPDTIILVPGHLQQLEALSGFCDLYKINPNIIVSKYVLFNEKFSTGKYRLFEKSTLPIYDSLDECESFYEPKKPSKYLIIGPPLGLGDKLICDELYFQGGYSPNSLTPIQKFLGVKSVQSFNPSGAKQDFSRIIDSKSIKKKFFIGKNVCHGFTKEKLSKIWRPRNKQMLTFYDSLEDSKAMHDVLAAMIMLGEIKPIWEQAEPIWYGNRLSTVPTQDKIYSLIGIRHENLV